MALVLRPRIGEGFIISVGAEKLEVLLDSSDRGSARLVLIGPRSFKVDVVKREHLDSPVEDEEDEFRFNR